jgi:agmatine deiminase
MNIRTYTTSLLALIILTSSTLAKTPTSPVRIIAEWEPVVGVLVAWPYHLPDELLIEIAKDDTLFILIQKKNEKLAQQQLQEMGVNMTNVKFIFSSIHFGGVRDAGPTQVFDGNGIWCMIEPLFKGWPLIPRFSVATNVAPIVDYQADWSYASVISKEIADAVRAPLYSMKVYLPRGNLLVDGLGTAFCTEGILTENRSSFSDDEFHGKASKFIGIHNLHVLKNIEEIGIQHLDCMMVLLDEERILVKQAPEDHPEYQPIEENVQLLKSLKTPYGRYYTIERIFCPEIPSRRTWDKVNDLNGLAAYTNSLILNKKVLVPLFGVPEDKQAIETWQRVMPGYKVVGFDWDYWFTDDALHCGTYTVFDRNMLYMAHPRLPKFVNYDIHGYPVVVTIDDRSESDLIIDRCNLVYRFSTKKEWTKIPLTPLCFNNQYTAVIPPFSENNTIEYYFEAADNSGRYETKPRTAPESAYSFQITSKTSAKLKRIVCESE